MTEHIEKILRGKSYKLTKESGIKGNFDFFIFSCGWESRCIEVINYDIGSFSFNESIIISFEQKDGFGYEPEYMEELEKFSRDKDCHAGRKEYTPAERESTAKKIITNLIKSYIKKKGPIILGFDITSCPRYLFLYLMAFCFEHNLCKEISFFYSEGIYSSNPDKYVHTKGKWRIEEIPGLEVKNYYGNKKLFVISVGWEGSRYLSQVSKYDPDEIEILLPDPGFTKEYTTKSIKECSPLIEEYRIPDESIIRAPAGDAVYAWKMLDAGTLDSEDYHIAYLTFGPKPHVLAMGLKAYVNRNISLLYRVPEGYHKIEVKPNGIFWRYDIKNLLYI